MRMLRHAKARWDEAGETKAVEWRWVRRALVLGGLSLLTSLLGVVFWVRELGVESERAKAEAAEATYEADLASYENARDEFLRCQQRVDGSARLSNLADATSKGFESVDRTFDEVIGVVEARNPESPTVVEMREAVNELSDDVAEVSAAAEQYERVPPSTCDSIVVPPQPVPPD